MSDLLLLGLSHKTTPVESRECIAFSKDETAGVLEALKKNADISEMVLLSTCNRVEVLMVSSNHSRAVETVKKFISESKKVPVSFFEEYLYIHKGDDAIRHVFKVASSLDSMMVGEPQILGQIKESYHLATLHKTSGLILNRLLPRAFSVAKRVRTETGIGDHAVSISYAAIELGRKIFDTLEAKKVLLIGAGEMIELAAEHLIKNKVGNIFVANRTFESGVSLAKKINGNAILFDEIENVLQNVDVVISSTGASEFIITRKQVKNIMAGRHHRPLFFIDIAVPRDIDPQINHLPNVYVYDIDDLKGIVEENIAERNHEAVKGERIIDENVINFRKWHDSLDMVPTIVALRKKIDDIANIEVNKTLKSLQHLSDNDLMSIRKMAHAMVNKFMHDPMVFLKRNGTQENQSVSVDIARKLFNLDDNDDT
jgi:glutamyl-tRNA reductase